MFRSVNRMFYRGVHGVGLIFDLTSQSSFKNLDSWLQEFIESWDKKDKELNEIGFILIGNKLDLVN